MKNTAKLPLQHIQKNNCHLQSGRTDWVFQAPGLAQRPQLILVTCLRTSLHRIILLIDLHTLLICLFNVVLVMHWNLYLALDICLVLLWPVDRVMEWGKGWELSLDLDPE